MIDLPHFFKFAYRTSDLNPIFRLIHSFTGDDVDRNKKRTGRNTDPSCLVAGTGFIFSLCSKMGLKAVPYKKSLIAKRYWLVSLPYKPKQAWLDGKEKAS